NTLVLRTDLSGNPTFRELLRRARGGTLDAAAPAGLPFEKVVEELQPERTLSHSPLFQVTFQLRNTPETHLQLPDLNIDSFDIDTGVSSVDLALEVAETVEGLLCMVKYHTDLFESATIARMLAHFDALLVGIVADPDRPVSDLPLLTDATRRQILVEWNDTAADFPKDACIHQLFESQVTRTPDAVAAVFEDEQLTYRELNTRANQLAHYLRTLGVGPETRVGICIERSLEMVVGILGVLKAGGAYVPFDPTYPKERLVFMIQDTQAPVVLTQARLKEAMAESVAHLVCLDTEW